MVQVVDIRRAQGPLCKRSWSTGAQHRLHEVVERLRACASGQQECARQQRGGVHANAARSELIGADGR